MDKNLDATYELTEKLDRIEDKILERGSFTKILGKDFSLSTSIDEIRNDEDMGHCFDLVIKITSPKKSLNDEKAEEISDHIGDNLFELIELENGDEARDEISGLLRESLVFFNDERVY